MDIHRLKRGVSLLAALVVPLVMSGCVSGNAGLSETKSQPTRTVLRAEAIVNHDPPPLEVGWTLATIEEEGFAIGLPPGWVEFDMTSNDLQGAIGQIRAANPGMATGLTDQVMSMAAQGIKLYAVDKYSSYQGNGISTNLNVLKQKVPSYLSLDELTSRTIAELNNQFGKDKPLQVMKNRLGINSGEAERLQYNWVFQLPSGKTINLALTQYIALYEGEAYIVTFGTTEDEFAGYAPNFDKSAKTLTFLKR